MTELKISIVTVSLNQGNFIEDAIQSVLNQNYKNFEHIIIDGMSTDNTINVLKKYEHLVWISEKDEGQSDALNKGFKKCTGDIIGWLNSDDMYLEDTFDTIVYEMQNSSIDAVYGNYMFMNKDKELTRKVFAGKPSKFISKFICFIPSTTFFFKKKIIEKNILIDKNFHIGMDKEWFANIFSKNYKIHKIDKFLAKFRWHDSNKSLDTLRVKKIRYKEGLIIYNRYSKRKLPDNIFGMILYILMQRVAVIYNGVSKRILFKK